MTYLQISKSGKWGNARKREVEGKIYDSGFEAEEAQELSLRQKAGDIKSWERQVRIPLIVNDYHICNYYIDFIVHHNDGTTEYIEVKGYATDVWKLKWKIFEALYTKDGNTLTVIKQKDNWSYRKPKKIIK